MHQPFAVYLILAIIAGGVVVGAYRGLRRRHWTEGEALVTDVVFRDHAFDEGAPGSQRHTVRAQVLTPDGEQHAGTAIGTYTEEAKQWLGQRRRAWYDPDRPERFTLVPPLRERGITGGDVFVSAIVVLILAVVLAVVLL
ncbi:DUF3592 domain-containing protein [Angustibacter sp. Root456]|uniref:DUF3592 domain-containing protein n=1 Tax=Angustibacter sp. Root456 TaxID=1736539 RepID=UPI0006FEC8EB|nr:DUF3592 domain-containing protein [Angustibacter sp. Root456]KQX65942.1 hypothetical protein ASD06_05955 [Angustibacter sp. Root456]